MVLLSNEGADTAQLVQRLQHVVDFYRLLHLRPAPGRRNRNPIAICGCLALSANSTWPLRIVVADIPVAWATA